MKSPIDVGAETASVYVAAVNDVDGLHDRAKAAGGNITKAPYNTCYGSREFEMKDPEGRVWFFGKLSNMPYRVPFIAVPSQLQHLHVLCMCSQVA